MKSTQDCRGVNQKQTSAERWDLKSGFKHHGKIPNPTFLQEDVFIKLCKNKLQSIVVLTLWKFSTEPSEYIPGTPGAGWNDDEVQNSRQKSFKGTIDLLEHF